MSRSRNKSDDEDESEEEQDEGEDAEESEYAAVCKDAWQSDLSTDAEDGEDVVDDGGVRDDGSDGVEAAKARCFPSL